MTDSTDYLSDAAIRARLAAERAALRQRLDRIPLELQTRRPAPDRWSIAEVLEHLGRIEGGVTKLLMLRGHEAPAADAPPPGPESVGSPKHGRMVRDRSRKIEAPERVRPAGALGPQEAWAQLEATRAKLLEAFAGADARSLDGLTHAHPVFGPLTLRTWVSFTADHEARHAAQIGEIAEQLQGSGHRLDKPILKS